MVAGFASVHFTRSVEHDIFLLDHKIFINDLFYLVVLSAYSSGAPNSVAPAVSGTAVTSSTAVSTGAAKKAPPATANAESGGAAVATDAENTTATEEVIFTIIDVVPLV